MIQDDIRMKRADYDDYIARTIGVDELPDKNRMLTATEIEEIKRLHSTGLGFRRIARLLELKEDAVKYWCSARSENRKTRHVKAVEAAHA
jgi:hypothetical protein